MTLKTSVLIVLLFVKLSNAKTLTTEAIPGLKKFEGFNNFLHQPVLATENLENVHQALDFVVHHTDFQPLVLSIGHFGSDSKILDQVIDYLKKRMLDHYQFDIEKLSEKPSDLPKGLTWIIVVDDFQSLNIQIHNDNDTLNAADQFFILFIGRKDNEPTNEWINIFRALWNRHRICKVLIASINDNFRYLYTYSPFVKSNEEFGAVQRLDIKDIFGCAAIVKSESAETKVRNERCHIEEKSGSVNQKLFEDFQDFNEYPVYITIFESQMMNISFDKDNKTIYTMLDANVMHLIQERLRSKFQIHVVEVRDDGDPFEEALDTIKQGGVSEFVFTAYFTKRYWRVFEFTASVYQDKLCLIAPSSQQLPKYLTPFLPFTLELWCVLIIYNLSVAIIWSLIQRIDSALHSKYVVPTEIPAEINIKVCKHPKSMQIRNVRLPGCKNYSQAVKCGHFERPRSCRPSLNNSKSSDEPPEIHSCLIGSFNLLTIACYPLYGGKTCTEKAFLFGSLFFALIVIGLYHSCLVTRFSKPTYYPELNSLLDVAESNRTIITKYHNLLEHTFPEGSPDTERLRRKTRISTSHERTYDMVAYGGFISLGRYSSFTLENLTAYYGNGGNKLLLHVVKECPTTYALSYVGKLHSPYLVRIDSLLLRIQQSGFIEKWYDEMVFQARVQESKSIPRPSTGRVKLTIEHLWLSFLGLAIGLFCSTIVFLGELHYAKKLRCCTSSNHHLSSFYRRKHLSVHPTTLHREFLKELKLKSTKVMKLKDRDIGP